MVIAALSVSPATTTTTKREIERAIRGLAAGGTMNDPQVLDEGLLYGGSIACTHRSRLGKAAK